MASADLQYVMAEPPRKRQRLSPLPASTSTTTAKQIATMDGDSATKQRVLPTDGFQPDREAHVGILHFVNDKNLGFTGTLKQRYTDFLVNEIAPDGTVVHLTDDKVPVFKNVTKKDNGESSKPPMNATRTFVAPKPEIDGGVSLTKKKLEETAPDPTPSEETAAAEVKGEDLLSSISSPAPIADLSKIPEKPVFSIRSEDCELLTKYVGATLAGELVQFHEKILAKPGSKSAVFGSLLSESITDRPLRGRLHQDVRRIFESRIETESIEDGKIRFSAAPPVKPHPEGYKRVAENPRQRSDRHQPKGKLGWQELGGQYLHFSLYKENKDTMEVISYLCKMLKIKPKDFAFAGTKDRRAVTVQRVSVFRQHANTLARLNPNLRQSRLGNFTYGKHQLELGELEGNQFTITLRDCHFGNASGSDDSGFCNTARPVLAEEVVGGAIEHLKAHGFINYFGLQRFGTYGIGTDEIGKKILKDDFEGAIWAILNYSDESLEAAQKSNGANNVDKIGRDDLARALAIHNFKTTGQSHYALEKLPKKFSAESQIIRHLSLAQKHTDFPGALLTINRNLRTMYVHAYQSLVWNFAASERWARYGSKVIEGDLVLVDTPAEKAAETRDEVDENGEVVIHPAADDVAVSHDDIFERARPLTADEAKSGKYTIFDIVLPTPGFDIEYPANDIGDFYKDFMGSERGGGLDPADMRRRIKDFSLSGSYRKLLARVGKSLSFEIKAYNDENEQLVETDLEKLEKSRPKGQGSSYGQKPRFENGPRNNENARFNDGLRNDRRERQNNRGGRGGGQNEDRIEKLPARQHEGKAVEQPRPEAFRPPTSNDARMSAWQNLPSQLAADDKSSAAAYEAQKLIPKNIDDIAQPVYKDTFIETSAENEGRRTGYRSTKILDNLADNAVRDDSKGPEVRIPQFDGTSDDMVVDTQAPDTAVENILNSSFVDTESADGSQDGGARLSMQNSPTKRPAAEISTSSDTNTPILTTTDLDNTVTDGDGPTSWVSVTEPVQKIAVILKFSLGTSQYATMALRELMKLGGVKTYKPDFSMGR